MDGQLNRKSEIENGVLRMTRHPDYFLAHTLNVMSCLLYQESCASVASCRTQCLSVLLFVSLLLFFSLFGVFLQALLTKQSSPIPSHINPYCYVLLFFHSQYLAICLSCCLCVCLLWFFCLSLFVCLFICLFIGVFVGLTVCLDVFYKLLLIKTAPYPIAVIYTTTLLLTPHAQLVIIFHKSMETIPCYCSLPKCLLLLNIVLNIIYIVTIWPLATNSILINQL